MYYIVLHTRTFHGQSDSFDWRPVLTEQSKNTSTYAEDVGFIKILIVYFVQLNLNDVAVKNNLGNIVKIQTQNIDYINPIIAIVLV